VVIGAELAAFATAKTASPLACRKGGIILVYIVRLSGLGRMRSRVWN